MKSSIIASIIAFTATTTLAQYQSPPFHLVVLSQNATINGSTLTACHEGAAIEGLCPSGFFSPPLSPTQFQFNTSDVDNTDGLITYALPVGNISVSEPLGLVYNPASNVALPLFFPGSTFETTVSFDTNNSLTIQNYNDDRVPPSNEPLNRWYVCRTRYGYTYTTLAWVLGQYPPQNPTCTKVDVVRVFV